MWIASTNAAGLRSKPTLRDCRQNRRVFRSAKSRLPGGLEKASANEPSQPRARAVARWAKQRRTASRRARILPRPQSLSPLRVAHGLVQPELKARLLRVAQAIAFRVWEKENAQGRQATASQPADVGSLSVSRRNRFGRSTNSPPSFSVASVQSGKPTLWESAFLNNDQLRTALSIAAAESRPNRFWRRRTKG